LKLSRFLITLVLLAISLTIHAQSWQPLTNPAPFAPGQTMLMMDGSVLVQDWETPNWWKLTPDANGSYVNGTWTQVASTPSTYGPLWFGSAVLPDGRVVVDGGEYNLGGGAVWTTLGAIYNPVSNTWSNLAPPSGWTVVGDAQTCVLPNGTLIMANLLNTLMASFNPSTNTWADLPNSGKTDRFDEEGWTLLPDGTMFTVCATNIGHAEKFIPSSSTWVSAGTTPVQLPDASSEELGPQILMPSGKVICFGAIGHNAVYVPPAVPTDPGTWQSAPDFPIEPVSGLPYAIADGTACLMPNGKVLCAASPGVFQSPTAYFEFDGTNLTQVTSPPEPSNASSYWHIMMMLPTGQVMLTNLNQVEIYTPVGSPNNAWRPTITNVPTDVAGGGTYTISGTQFNGLSQCSAYGDDEQNATNYPIVRITNTASGHVFYCRTSNPSSMGVATGAQIVSVSFTPPLTLEDGPSTIEVVANGISSGAGTQPVAAHATYTKNVTVSPTAAVGGNTATGTVNLNLGAPSGGLTVNLSSNSPNAVVPPTVTIPQNATSATFSITTSNTTYSSVTATITESYGAESNHQCTLKVQPNNRAQFISQTCPTTMIAGQSYPVNLQFKNLGTTTWDGPSGHNYQLYSANPYNNSNWGFNRINLQTASVAPNATGNFAATAIAPMTAGTYNFQWQPYEGSDATLFGPNSTTVVVTVTKNADAARYISRTGVLTVNAGTDFWVQNTMMNVGTNNWTSSGGYHMVSVNPYKDPKWTAINLFMPANSTIAPGAQATFTGLCTAPLTPGTYTMQWSVDKNGVTFGDRSPLLSINVTQGPDDAQYVSATTFSKSIAPSGTFGVTFTMTNLGTATWDSTYSLLSVGSNNFGVASIVSGSVAPSTNGTFTGSFTAPATPGTYTFGFRMAHNTTKFGQPTPLTSIVVSADAAQYISRTGVLTVNAGQDFYVQNLFKDTGSTSWSTATGYSMMTVYPANNDATWTVTRGYLASGTIAPGVTGTFTALCTAPITPGTYHMQWQMDKSGTPFGEKSPLLTMTVVLGSDDAQYVSQSGIPTTIVHSTTFTPTITMKNLGTATWDNTYSLVSIGSNNFGVTSITAASTAQNANDAFSTTFTAPATPGTYTFQMRMQHGTTKFGQVTVKVTITVT